jgi:hypothetical protein
MVHEISGGLVSAQKYHTTGSIQCRAEGARGRGARDLQLETYWAEGTEANLKFEVC